MSEQAVGCGEPGGGCPAAEAIGNFLESSLESQEVIFVTQVSGVGRTRMTAPGFRFGPKNDSLERWFDLTETPMDCPVRRDVNDMFDKSEVRWSDGYRCDRPEPVDVKKVIFGTLKKLRKLRDGAATNCSSEQQVTIAGSDQ
jgi:hypothetical protein